MQLKFELGRPEYKLESLSKKQYQLCADETIKLSAAQNGAVS